MRYRRIFAVFASYFILAIFSAGAQVTINMFYYADGNLVAKTVNGVTTRYLIDDMNPTGLPQVVEETVNGVVQRRYTYGTQRISETQLINGAWVTSYYVYDAQGNVRQLTDAAGVVTDTYDYDAFGNLINHTGTTPNVYLYRGELYDRDINMYYMRARWYNPVTGRFMSKDPKEGNPSDPASLHKYLYVGGDPVNKEDPTGRNTAVLPRPAVPGGSMIEDAAIIGTISLGAVTALKSLSCEEKISLASDGIKLLGGTPIEDPSHCTAQCKTPTSVEEIKSQCTPGLITTEPATGNAYKGKGCISYEQLYTCCGVPVYIHWIMCPGKPDPVHGPHYRPYPTHGGTTP
jgi:RHS repeat-associated protein